MGKHLQTVVAMTCMKTLLMLFNVAFWCIGIAMLCVGIWMRINLQKYVDVSVEANGAAPIALACLGILITLAASLACCCTTRGHPALLYMYGTFLAAVVLLKLGAGASIYAYRTSLTDGFDQGLNESLAVYGEDESRTSDIDSMQSTLHCCGNHGYTDWAATTPPHEIPKSCCINDPKKCHTSDPDDIYKQGCYDRVIDTINSNIGLVAGSAVGIAFFPFIGIFLACCLASNINKARYEQVA